VVAAVEVAEVAEDLAVAASVAAASVVEAAMEEDPPVAAEVAVDGNNKGK
jgi:predicted ATP-dependent serine protease